MIRRFSIKTILLLASTLGCGDRNIFENKCEEFPELGCPGIDPAEKALILIEQKENEKAMALMRKSLASNPEYSTYKSVLASAIAGFYGIDMISIGLSMAKNDSENSNSITSMFSFLPAASDTNIAGLSEAVEILNSIPVDDRLSGDSFKIVLLNTSLTGLVTKKFDQDGDANMTIKELNELTEADAIIILNALTSAISILDSDNLKDQGTSSAALANIAGLQTSINKAEGDDNVTKLKNFLSSDNGNE